MSLLFNLTPLNPLFVRPFIHMSVHLSLCLPVPPSVHPSGRQNHLWAPSTLLVGCVVCHVSCVLLLLLLWLFFIFENRQSLVVGRIIPQLVCPYCLSLFICTVPRAFWPKETDTTMDWGSWILQSSERAKKKRLTDRWPSTEIYIWNQTMEIKYSYYHFQENAFRQDSGQFTWNWKFILYSLMKIVNYMAWNLLSNFMIVLLHFSVLEVCSACNSWSSCHLLSHLN